MLASSAGPTGNSTGISQLQGVRIQDFQAPAPKPWRILSLDGSGVKGLAELLILERIMTCIRKERNNAGAHDPKHLRPCDFFDFIGGTPTGGLIAIMLRRLRLTVPEALYRFKSVSKRIFTGSKPGNWTKFWKGEVVAKPFYDGVMVSTQVKRVLRDMHLSELVTATTHKTNDPFLIRSYHDPTGFEKDYHFTIAEAAACTSATQLYFDPIRITRPREPHLGDLVLSDGGLNNNNPINQVMDEVRCIDSMRPIGCVVITGTELSDNDPVGKRIHEIAKNYLQTATNSRKIAYTYGRSDQGQQLRSEKRYWRFNVTRRMDTIDLDDVKRLDDIEDFVRSYLETNNDVQEDIEACARILSDPLCNIVTTSSAPHFILATIPNSGRVGTGAASVYPSNISRMHQSRVNHLDQYSGNNTTLDEIQSNLNEGKTCLDQKGASSALKSFARALTHIQSSCQPQKNFSRPFVEACFGVSRSRYMRMANREASPEERTRGLTDAKIHLDRAQAAAQDKFELGIVHLGETMFKIYEADPTYAHVIKLTDRERSKFRKRMEAVVLKLRGLETQGEPVEWYQAIAQNYVRALR